MTVSIIGLINQWEQSNLEIFPPSNIYNVLVGTNLNPSGYKFFVVGNSKIEGDLEITGNLSAVIQTLKVIEKTDNVDYLITFITSTGNQIPFYANGQIKYNPSTNKLTVGNLTSNISTSTGYLTSNLVGLLQNNQLQNDSITIDSINLELGSSYTQLALNLVNSTGYLTSNLVGLLQNNQLQNDSITIGSTEIDLGNTITTLVGMSSITSTNFIGSVSTIEITDTGDNTDYYLVFTNSAGSGKTLRVNETASPGDTFTYNPSTNKLTVLRVYCGFIEADNYINVKTSELNGLIENLQLRNSIITIGTTGINLGNTKTEIVGLTKLAIGTSSPTTILDVRSTDSYTQGLFQNNNATNPGHIIIRNESYNEQIQIRSRYDGEDNHIFTWNGSALANLRLNGSIMLLGNGNVGIGTSSPNQQLEVYGKTLLGTEHTFNVFIYNSTTYNNATETFAQNICFQDDSTMRYGLVAVNTNSALTTNKGASIGFGIADTANNVKIGNSIESITNDFNAITSDLVFKTIGTSDGYVLNTESMRITSAGKVGIGTTNPTNNLHISGSGSSTVLMLENTETGANEWGFHSMGSVRTGRLEIQSQGGTDTIPFTIEKSCPSHTLYLNSAGNVGIRTTNPNYILDLGQSYGNTNQASAKKLALYNNSDGNGFYGFGISASLLNFYADCSATGEPQMVLKGNGNVGIGYTDPQNKLEVLGDIKCGNSANSDTALDIEINSSYAYGMLIGGWSTGGRLAGNAAIEMSVNLHIDSPVSGPIGAGDIYLNNYNAGRSTFIRNRVDISDKRIKKDIVEIETEEQFNETFEIIKKVGSYKYKYRDIYRENDLDQYGFIAQEVLENYPVACKLAGNNCYLPNIMETLNFTYEVGDDNEYTFNIEGYDLDVNIKYIFYAFREGVEQFDYLENIEPTTNNTFTYTPTIIKNEEPPTYIKLVLVGTYTDDKLGVSKDKLFQLGFAGVRGLIDENEKMKNENETLKNRIDILEENQKKMIQKLNELIYGDNCWFKNSI